MNDTDLQIKQDGSTINDIAEKMQLASNTNMVTKLELLQQLIAKQVAKSKMLNVSAEMFIQHEKEQDESNQIFNVLKFLLQMIKLKTMS